MALDPSIITGALANWQTPAAFDPISQIAKIQALKNGVTQAALQQQNLQIGQMQLQAARDAEAQRQRDLNDQTILQQAAQDPATMKAITSWDGQSPFPLAGRGLQFKTMQDMQAKVLADQKAALQWNEDQRKANLSKLDRVGAVLPGLMYDENGKPRPDADIAAAAPGLISQLQKEGVLTGQAPTITSFADAQKYALANGYIQGIDKYAQGQRDAAAKPALTEAQTAEAKGKGAQSQAEADKQTMINNAMKAAQANPQQGAALIDAAIPPGVDPQANAGYKAAWQAAMSVGNADGAAQIVKTAAEHSAALSPATTQQEVNKAVAVKKATAPIEVATEVAKQKALAANSPEMFAGITDPVTRRKAQDDYNKETGAYYDKVAPAQQLKDFIAAARSGNKAAPGLIPMAVVRSIVNRVSTPELKAQVGGSVADKVQGWFTGATEGQPIPSDILDGMAQIADIEMNNTRANYENKVRTLGATYGPGVRPAPPLAGPSAAPVAVNPYR